MVGRRKRYSINERKIMFIPIKIEELERKLELVELLKLNGLLEVAK